MIATMDRRHFLGLAAAGLAGYAAFPAFGGERELVRIGIGSCTNQAKPQPLWDTVLADRPDLFIFGGDNVYASGQPFSIARLQQAYEVEAAVPEFARLREAVPNMAIWDDHDYGKNDGGAEFEHKQVSKEAFLKFWRASADDARRTREGIYDAKVFGPASKRVQVIALDTRWFRSPWKPTDARDQPGRERYLPDSDPSKTMLGAAQWRWLEEQLRQPAELRLIVSGVQVIAQGHGWEHWGNFPLERQRLLDTIANTGAQGVVLLSGDRHIGAIYRETRSAYPLYELTASGVTHTWLSGKEAGPNRVGELFTELHYGMVEIDWPQSKVSLVIKDIRGAARRTQVIPFDELKAPT
jgi:alkaline phosphatase D